MVCLMWWQIYLIGVLIFLLVGLAVKRDYFVHYIEILAILLWPMFMIWLVYQAAKNILRGGK